MDRFSRRLYISEERLSELNCRSEVNIQNEAWRVGSMKSKGKIVMGETGKCLKLTTYCNHRARKRIEHNHI